ncbi:uncharacterized protein Bfra_010457 [Botrytis fragariae]|uniref:Uncharacterized protein n=1 Tax=Botrytis fragariae TaxID=1964551 RepID=A0A8H6ECR6_9HELO|nr:uncharacterized protein Bfra_010457 [Botrytis fragariae]KAF5867483.1 hypothetical protein Bfra_010457 [Botrytis fragariae]
MELDCPDPEVMRTKCVMKLTSNANAQQPAYSLVCHEARDAALKDDWEDPNLLNNPWFNPGKDIMHLNGDQSDAEDYEISSDQIPHQTLIAYAKIARGGSFMATLVHPFEKPGYFFSSQPLIDEVKGNFPLIEQMNGFKVCLTVITIHATTIQVVERSAVWEFGGAGPTRRTLGSRGHSSYLKDSEPVEIFEEMIPTPDDFEARVCKWHEEYERHRYGTLNSIDSPRDVWTGPDFDHLGRPMTGLNPENIYMPSHEFNRAHPWLQSILDKMPRFHPVIMFRFCEAKCTIES